MDVAHRGSVSATRVIRWMRARVLLIELEGLREVVEEQADSGDERYVSAQKAREVRAREGRRGARAAMERTQDGLRGARAGQPFLLHARWCCASQPDTCGRCDTLEMSRKKYDLTIGNIFHAGDGNLHPLILFDMRNAEQFERVFAASRDILRVLHSMWRLHYRGTRRRDGEARSDVAAVHRRRSRRHDQPA